MDSHELRAYFRYENSLREVDEKSLLFTESWMSCSSIAPVLHHKKPNNAETKGFMGQFCVLWENYNSA